MIFSLKSESVDTIGVKHVGQKGFFWLSYVIQNLQNEWPYKIVRYIFFSYKNNLKIPHNIVVGSWKI